MGGKDRPMRLCAIDGVVIGTLAGRSELRMKPHKHLRRDLGANPLGLEGSAKAFPVLRRYALASPPLLNPPKGLIHGLSKSRGRPEGIEQGSDVVNMIALHAPVLTSDKESGQCRTSGAMTSVAPKRTMCPMGKAATPSKFRSDFCRRVRAARVLSGLTQVQAASLLGVKEDTYSKYERRTEMPHYLLPRACHYFGVSPDELYGFVARPDLDLVYEEVRKTG